MRNDVSLAPRPLRRLPRSSSLAVLVVAATALLAFADVAQAKPIVHGCSKPLPGAGRIGGKGIVRPGGRACAAAEAGEPLRVLVYSRTGGFRHASIDDAKEFFTTLPESEGIVATLGEDPELFNDETLAAFDVVAFVNTTGEILDDAQQAALERFVRSGHGWVGVHSAADTEYEWNWYGRLVGAYFVSHPILPVEVEVTTEDAAHASTDHLPAKFLFTDEIYNFDRNPRFDNAILLTIDEAGFTYPNFPGGPSMGADHPVAWFKEYDGGRSFYTNLGHRPESWRDPRFQEHLLDGIRWAAGPPTWSLIPVSRQARNPLTMDVAPDGRVFYVERTGEVWSWSPKTGRASLAAKFDVSLYGENGLLGIGLDPDFVRAPWVYLFYALDDFQPPPDFNADDLPYDGPLGENVLARFRLKDDGTLDLDSYEELLRTPSERVGGHEGGQITFLADGTLVLSVGDNTNPFGDAFGFATIDERPERDRYDARRTSSNALDLRGKILRLNRDGSIPRGNLFPSDGSEGRPEIYVMGARNPFRSAADPKTGRLYFGDIGPDAPTEGPRGPRGYDEINVVDGPGNYGWPFCIGENKPYNEYSYETQVAGAPYSCDGYVPATIAYDYTTVSHLALGNARGVDGSLTGRSAMAGTVVRRPAGKAPFRLPDTYEGALFMTDWTRDVIAAVDVDRQGKLESIRRVLPWMPFHRPVDLEIGPDGALYVLEYGTGFGGDNDDAQLTRIEFSPDGDLTPVASVTASKTAGVVPLTVQLSAAGSRAPGAGGVIVSYAWDVDGNGVTDYSTPEVEHTFTQGGVQYASLVITDGAGRKSFPDVVEITTGNEPPVVTIETPAAGTVGQRGATIVVRGSATDREDGVAACDRLSWGVSLGHNAHAHPQRVFKGCEGSFPVDIPEDHANSAALFMVVELSYEDDGGPNGERPLTGLATLRLNVE